MDSIIPVRGELQELSVVTSQEVTKLKDHIGTIFSRMRNENKLQNEKIHKTLDSMDARIRRLEMPRPAVAEAALHLGSVLPVRFHKGKLQELAQLQMFETDSSEEECKQLCEYLADTCDEVLVKDAVNSMFKITLADNLIKSLAWSQGAEPKLNIRGGKFVEVCKAAITIRVSRGKFASAPQEDELKDAFMKALENGKARARNAAKKS